MNQLFNHILGDLNIHDRAISNISKSHNRLNTRVIFGFAAMAMYMYANNKKIKQLESEIEELKQMKGE